MQASVRSSEPEQAPGKPVNITKEMKSELDPIASQSIIEKDSSKKPESAAPPEPTLTSKPSKERETVGLAQTDIQIFESLPQIAKIRSGPDMDTAVLQRIPQGTRLKVVGREGDWLKLQLRNGSTGWIYHSLVQEVDITPKPPAPQVATESSANSEQDALSIQRLVERWRQAWEEGDTAAYVACYNPDFERAGMDRSGWGKYMRYRFEGSAKWDIQLSDLHITVSGSEAVVTFKQHYQTETYQEYGLKTLHLRRDQDHWNIFKETVQPLAARG
jgi:ketosteroid isomerase-like protein